MIYLLTRAAWPRKEIKNQCYHTLAGIAIGLISYAICRDVSAVYVSVACFSLGMEIDHYAKSPGRIKLYDCIRDFCFYMIGAIVAGWMV